MAWINNNKKNARFNPNKRDDFLLMAEVVSRRQHKETRAQREAAQEEADAVPMELADVLGKKPESRFKWLQKALLHAARGKAQVTTLYDIVAHPKFVIGVSPGVGSQMRELLLANLHLFSTKQQKFFKSDSSKFNTFADNRRGLEADDDSVVEAEGLRAQHEGSEVRREVASLSSDSLPRDQDASCSGSSEPSRSRSHLHSHSCHRSESRSHGHRSRSRGHRRKQSRKQKHSHSGRRRRSRPRSRRRH